jgi:predicted nucleotidyltransferase
MTFGKLEEELEDVELVKKQKTRSKASADGYDKDEIMQKVVDFTNQVRKNYGDLIKSVLIFGSIVRGDAKKSSDADVWVILDDTATKGSEDLEKIQAHMNIIAHELKDVHVQTTPITEFWHWIKVGSPELVNFLRYGLPIYDSGFIKPVQRMLNMGLLPPSEETVSLRARAAEARYRKTKIDMKSMIFDLRYCASDIIQAAVMYHYKDQPDLKDIPKFLERFVKEKKLEKVWIEKFEQINKLWKDIDHKVVKSVDAEYLNKALTLSKEIIERFKKLIPKEVLGEELPPEE